MKLNDFAAEVHALAVEKGWWENAPTFPEVITMIHCELSEAVQEYRDGKPAIYYPCNAGGLCVDDEPEKNVECGSRTTNCRSRKPEGVAVELADAVLRILDYCAAAGIDIESVLETKHEYNKGREYRHGGKLI